MKQSIFIFMITVLLVSCAPAAQGTPVNLTPINVCYSALAGTQAVTWYAYENGIFEKYGLRVNLVSITGGSAATTVLVSGDMDICQVAAPSVINAVAAGQDLVIIAGLINIAPGSLMAQPDITDATMLKGKIIGNNQGSSTEAVTRIALKSMGLDPDKDVVLLNIGGEEQRVAALEAKKVDATLVIPPLTITLRNEGYTELLNVSNLKIPYQGTSIATTRRFLKEHRAQVVGFMKAILEAIVRIKKDPQGSKNVIAKYLSLDPVKDSATLDETYNAILLGTLEDIPYPSMQGIQTVIDIAAQGNTSVAKVTPGDVVDISIVQGLEASGFISGLK
jgi:NitT/TauT family transport system substrate-binding protein